MKKKLELKKKTISVLSDQELRVMDGGEEAVVTTSFGKCTGFACCTPTQSVTVIITFTLTYIPR